MSHRHSVPAGTKASYTSTVTDPDMVTDPDIIAAIAAHIAEYHTPVPPPPPSGYPPDTTLANVTLPTVPAVPGYLSPVVDPTWGTTITRISNVPGQRHSYSRLSAWNCDASKILLGFGYPGRMLDGTTYADLGAFSQISQAIWSNTDPNKLYGVGANNLYAQNATTGALTTLHTFTPYSTISIGEYEGGISDDDKYMALIADFGTSPHLISYDVSTNSVIADIPAPPGIGDAQISRLGNYITCTSSLGIRRYPRALSAFITLCPSSNHGDNALDAAGVEVFVANSSPQVNAFRLSDGLRTQLLVDPCAFAYGHTSGRNRLRNGWAYLSVYDDTINLPGRDQVVAVKLDGSGTVEVFGFSNSRGSTYVSEPHAVPSPDGKRVLFASNYGTASTYAFVAEKK